MGDKVEATWHGASATVTTPEELRALPWDSVILDARGVAHQHIEEFDNGPLHWRNPYNDIRDWVRLPATVLHPTPKPDHG